MAKHKLTAEQREEVRKDAKEKLSGGAPAAEIVKSIAQKYGITTVSARNYLPDGEALRQPTPPRKVSKAKKPKAKAHRKLASTKKPALVRRKKLSNVRRSPATRRTPKLGGRLLQVVAKFSEGDLRRALGVKRLWSKRERLLERRRQIERELRQVDGKVKTLETRISRITAG